jgi:conjugative transfer signal peptidase TraF
VKRYATWTLVIAFAFLGFYASEISPWFLAWNRTDSIPEGLYLAHRGAVTLTRGQLVCFRYREPAWAVGRYLPNGAQICKEVLGLPGDTVKQQGVHLQLARADGGAESLGDLLPADSKGRSVPPQSWGRTLIPQNRYYLGSTRIPASFDSRYLGLIDKADVLERIYPLYTF